MVVITFGMLALVERGWVACVVDDVVMLDDVVASGSGNGSGTETDLSMTWTIQNKQYYFNTEL